MTKAFNLLTSQFNKDWLSKLAIGYLIFFLIVALGASWWPLPHGPNEINLYHIYQVPAYLLKSQTSQSLYLLGTDQLGRDLFANLVFGARTALLISLPAMLVATIVGVGLGSLAGFFGNQGFRISLATLLAWFLAALIFIFYGFFTDWISVITGSPLSKSINIILTGLGAALLFLLFRWLLNQVKYSQKRLSLPIDVLVLKVIELIQSVPRLLLVLALASFVTQSFGVVIFLAVITYWPGIARLVRAEIIKIKAMPFMEAAVALGLPNYRIILKHALPNVLTPIIVSFAFGLSNLMALESTLSFLGIGIPPDVPSWGRAIVGVRLNMNAWWLVLFPGLVLCITVLAIQRVGNYVIKQVNPMRNKN